MSESPHEPPDEASVVDQAIAEMAQGLEDAFSRLEDMDDSIHADMAWHEGGEPVSLEDLEAEFADSRE